MHPVQSEALRSPLRVFAQDRIVVRLVLAEDFLHFAICGHFDNGMADVAEHD